MRSLGKFFGLVATIVSVSGGAPAHAQPAPVVASLGTCPLESGAVIPDCRVAYRVFGRANAAHSNVVVVPTWLLGRSEDWVWLLGANKLIDTTRFQVLVVDALADGLSSSPSNTAPAARSVFDSLTIGDMVEAQHRLLRDRLGLARVHAIVGISMGGMQTLEWGVRHPGFASRLVPMMGSPRVPAHDRLMWTAQLRVIEDGLGAGMPRDTIWARIAAFEMLFVQTPAGLNARGYDSVRHDVAIAAAGYGKGWALEDYAAQLRAISRHDVSRSVGGDLSRAAATIRVPTLAVYSWDDHMVTAGPMAAFARQIGADTLAVRSDCGHIAFSCQTASIGKRVRAFLER
jgi:homoserine O-acetyltransferase